ncbi:MAG: hypothetical protein HY698_22640 [Deltaproteobacteria bacterium]|nr:hypothetical protein [Deltaproteobacteria bacterium]
MLGQRVHVVLLVVLSGCGSKVEKAGKPKPASATVDADGGVVSLVTDDGSRVTIAFPAGAVSGSTSVRLIPAAPTGTNWLALEITPAGIVVDSPLTITVELPLGAATSTVARLAFESEPGDGHVFLPTIVSDGGRTLSTQVRYLGLPGVGPDDSARARSGSASPMDSEYWRRFFLVAGEYPLAVVIPALELLRDTLVRGDRYEDAVSLIAGIVMLIQLRGEEGWDAELLRFMNETHQVACTQLGERTQALATTPTVQSPRQVVALAKPIVVWAEIEQRTNISGAPCAAAGLGAAGDTYAWAETIGKKAQASREAYDQVGRRAFLLAECDATPAERRPAECAGLASQAGTADSPTQAEVGVATESVRLTFEDTKLVRALELGTSAGSSQAIPVGARVFRSSLAEPEADVARKEAHAFCRKNNDQSEIGRLISVVPLDLREPLQRDGQHCASLIDLESPPGKKKGEIGGYEPGNVATELKLRVRRQDSLRLAGNLRALHCPLPRRVELDTLVATAIGLRSTEVGRRSARDSDNLLAMPLELSVTSLLSQAGLDPDTDSEFMLELRRDGPGCDGLYGAVPVTLYSIEVHVCAPPPACQGTCGCFSYECGEYNCGTCGPGTECRPVNPFSEDINESYYKKTCEPCPRQPTRSDCPRWGFGTENLGCGWFVSCHDPTGLTPADDMFDCDPDPNILLWCQYYPQVRQTGSCN